MCALPIKEEEMSKIERLIASKLCDEIDIDIDKDEFVNILRKKDINKEVGILKSLSEGLTDIIRFIKKLNMKIRETENMYDSYKDGGIDSREDYQECIDKLIESERVITNSVDNLEDTALLISNTLDDIEELEMNANKVYKKILPMWLINTRIISEQRLEFLKGLKEEY